MYIYIYSCLPRIFTVNGVSGDVQRMLEILQDESINIYIYIHWLYYIYIYIYVYTYYTITIYIYIYITSRGCSRSCGTRDNKLKTDRKCKCNNTFIFLKQKENTWTEDARDPAGRETTRYCTTLLLLLLVLLLVAVVVVVVVVVGGTPCLTLRSVFIIWNREISNWASQILKANMLLICRYCLEFQNDRV